MDLRDEELLQEARDLLESGTETKLDDTALICECMCITVGEIRDFTKGKIKNLNLEELKVGLKLGSGCSSCTKTFVEWRSKI